MCAFVTLNKRLLTYLLSMRFKYYFANNKIHRGWSLLPPSLMVHSHTRCAGMGWDGLRW